jgi:outer membrane lipoprotein-sorting protein
MTIDEHDHEMTQAELLEEYCDCLAADPASPPPEGLDPQLAALSCELAVRHVAPLPRPEAAAELRRRLEAQAEELARARAPRRTARPAPRPALALPGWLRLPALRPAFQVALAILLAAIAIGGYLFLSQPEPVSAREILQKAQANFTSPQITFLLRTVSRQWPARAAPGGAPGGAYPLGARGVLTYPGPLAGPPAQSVLVVESERLYGGPGLWRVESTQVARGPAGEELSRTVSIEVADGADLWRYDPQANVATVDALEGYLGGAGGTLLGFGQGLTDVEGLLTQAERCFDPVVTARETVAGRPVYRIDLGRNSCQIAAAPEFGGRMLLWVDQETAFILKFERYLPGTDQLAERSEVVEVQYNVALDPAEFTFELPAGARLVDNRPKPAPGPDDFRQRLAAFAASADFPILIPADPPEGLAPRQPRLDPLGDGSWQLLVS